MNTTTNSVTRDLVSFTIVCILRWTTVCLITVNNFAFCHYTCLRIVYGLNSNLIYEVIGPLKICWRWLSASASYSSLHVYTAEFSVDDILTSYFTAGRLFVCSLLVWLFVYFITMMTVVSKTNPCLYPLHPCRNLIVLIVSNLYQTVSKHGVELQSNQIGIFWYTLIHIKLCKILIHKLFQIVSNWDILIHFDTYCIMSRVPCVKYCCAFVLLRWWLW